jgi:hypothetical protein
MVICAFFAMVQRRPGRAERRRSASVAASNTGQGGHSLTEAARGDYKELERPDVVGRR